MLEILKLPDLFERDLAIVHDCERRLINELPKAIQVSSSAQLRNALAHDLEQTAAHLSCLDRIFAAVLREVPEDESDRALKSIFHEGELLIDNIDRSALLDSALIVFVNQVHHHKIALYQSLWCLAQALGLNQAIAPLGEAMNDEKAANEALTRIGLESVHPAAVSVMNPPHHWTIL